MKSRSKILALILVACLPVCGTSAAVLSPKTVHLLLEPATDPSLSIVSNPELVFDWTQPQCDGSDPYRFSDVPANAFKTNDGRVHLRWGHGGKFCFEEEQGIGAAYELVGENFDTLQDNCVPSFLSSFDTDHTQFNDHEWLHSFWIESTESGPENIAALIHMEYHSECLTPGTDLIAANNPRSITFAYSTDSGQSFVQPVAPNQLVATTPYTWTPGTPERGLCEGPTNILEKDGWFYCMFRFRAYRTETAVDPIQERLTVMRTRDPFDPNSWRAWAAMWPIREVGDSMWNLSIPIRPQSITHKTICHTGLTFSQRLMAGGSIGTRLWSGLFVSEGHPMPTRRKSGSITAIRKT